MKISAFTKHLATMALVLGVAVGCATTQQQQAEQQCQGMSANVKAAISDAQAKNQDARAMGADWRGAAKLIGQAQDAGNNCDDQKAMRLARDAKMMAQESIDAYRKMEQEQQQAQKKSEEKQMPQNRSYTVERGDTLWGISGSSVGYNDPYEWPLIYRANADMINDPDLIYPGQDLTIEANPSSDAVDAAVKHAKNRGSWSLGVVEQSDKAYLNEWGK